MLSKRHAGCRMGYQPDIRQRHYHAAAAVEVKPALLCNFIEIAPGEYKQIVGRIFLEYRVWPDQKMRSRRVEAVFCRSVIDHVIEMVVRNIAVLNDCISASRGAIAGDT